MYGNWFDFNLPYYEHYRDKKNFLFLTYKEMKLMSFVDHKGCVVRISDFLSRPLSEEHVDKAVEITTFSNMKAKNPTSFQRNGEISKRMRKCVVEDWKTRFTVTQNERFDAIYNQRMEGSALAKLASKIVFEI
ncbi:sulfotransferase 1C2A-like [Antedon mediterranea]|uniref:sulfotransferase 1C2A-like n=1 Tax=Antedon mediterranea TaxID=105859 RepID=UPI003AF9A198